MKKFNRPKRFAYPPITGSAREICEFFDREHIGGDIDSHVKAKAMRQHYIPRNDDMGLRS